MDLSGHSKVFCFPICFLNSLVWYFKSNIKAFRFTGAYILSIELYTLFCMYEKLLLYFLIICFRFWLKSISKAAISKIYTSYNIFFVPVVHHLDHHNDCKHPDNQHLLCLPCCPGCHHGLSLQHCCERMHQCRFGKLSSPA